MVETAQTLEDIQSNIFKGIKNPREIPEGYSTLVLFIPDDEIFDTNSALGRCQFGIFASLAEYEREIIVERTRAGLQGAKELRDEELYFRGSRNQRLIDVQTSLQKGETVIYHYNPKKGHLKKKKSFQKYMSTFIML